MVEVMVDDAMEEKGCEGVVLIFCSWTQYYAECRGILYRAHHGILINDGISGICKCEMKRVSLDDCFRCRQMP